ncbi:DHS-like NAD/FAD-binding domain-containing protein [Boletus edulis]|nr:DHS-like NAD/FAD-binding domain-containing protein [Boletus edulis]
MTVTLDLNASVVESSIRKALLDVSLAVAKCKKIVVVTGAGISCSGGIPDFRSSDGLYALVKQQHPGVVLKGRDLFDASLFRDKISTAVFYTFVSQLKRRIDSATPTPTHSFIKTLDTKQKLLRSYTQNIDGFEERVGLHSSSSQPNTSGKGKSRLGAAVVRNVQLHGDIHRVRCTLCSLDLPFTEGFLDSFNQGVAPECPECKLRSETRVARSARPLKVGSLRPAIVLYDEVHPLGDDIGLIQTQDIARKPDMLIIMGTSLKVHGLKKLVKDFAKAVHAWKTSSAAGTAKSTKSWQGKVVFVNRTPPGSEWEGVIDYHVSGETDTWVERVLEDWKKLRPSDWEVQQTLDGDGVFKVAKESGSAVTQKKSVCRRKSFTENTRREDKIISSLTPPFKPTSSAPSSPSKRRQSDCHYSDTESSPRKRRGVYKGDSCLERLKKGERRLLFLDTTNSTSQVDGPKGVDSQPSRMSDRQPRSRTMSKERSVKTPRTRSVTRPNGGMWVEIKKKAA